MWYNLAVLIVVVHAAVSVKVLPYEPHVNALIGTMFILAYGAWSLWLNWYRPKFSNEFVSFINVSVLFISAMLMFINTESEMHESWFMSTWACGFLIIMMMYPGKFVYVPWPPRDENPIRELRRVK